MKDSSTVADRKNDGSYSKAADQVTNVYIGDMDETRIKSLIQGTYPKALNGSKDVEKGVEIGRAWENHILQLCDDLFFYELRTAVNLFLDSLRQYDDGQDLSNCDFDQDGFTTPSDDLGKRKLAYRHRAIANKYKQGLRKLLEKEMISLFDDLNDMSDKYTDGWLSSVYNSWDVGNLNVFKGSKNVFAIEMFDFVF